MAGAPLGNDNRARSKRWAAAIERAIGAWPNPSDDTDCSALIKGLNMAAHGFVAKMIAEKDLGFYREFGDRLDGKAKQQTELTGAEGEPLVTRIELVALSGNSKD
jgi:hypothetical protein